MNPTFAFVCGCPRSGTSAFTRLLNTHPNVVMGVERFKLVTGELTPAHFEPAHFLEKNPNESTRPWEGQEEARAKLESGEVKILGDKYPGYVHQMARLFQRRNSTAKLFVVGYTSFFSGDDATLAALTALLGLPPSAEFEQSYRKYVDDSAAISARREQDLDEATRAEILKQCDLDLDLAQEVVDDHWSRNGHLYVDSAGAPAPRVLIP